MSNASLRKRGYSDNDVSFSPRVSSNGSGGRGGDALQGDSPPVVWAEGVAPSLYLPHIPQRHEVVVIGGPGDTTCSPRLRRLEGQFSVRLLAQAIQVLDGVTFFAVDVFPGSTGVAPWRVMRRYTEFRDLAKSVASDSGWRKYGPSMDGESIGTAWLAKFSSFAGLGSFPKKMLNCRGKALKSRRQRLETWINRLVSQHSWHSPSGDHLCRFLLFGRGAVPTSCSWSESTLPKAPPLAFNAAVEDAQALAFVLVKLPPEVGACQELTVKVHVGLGGQVTITVPWGVAAGAVLGLWFDPKAGTLGAGDPEDWQAFCAA